MTIVVHPLYMYVTLYTIYAPNTLLNTSKHTFIRPIYALKQPIKQVPIGIRIGSVKPGGAAAAARPLIAVDDWVRNLFIYSRGKYLYISCCALYILLRAYSHTNTGRTLFLPPSPPFFLLLPPSSSFFLPLPPSSSLFLR